MIPLQWYWNMTLRLFYLMFRCRIWMGFETAKLMRENRETSHIPIIFVTAINKEKRHIFKGYKSGAVDYLFKPIDEEILNSKVSVFLELNRQKKLIEEQAKLMQEQAQFDSLTKLPNRMLFTDRLNHALDESRRNNHKLAILFLDLDRFKNVNDTLGHDAGDLLLKEAAERLEIVFVHQIQLPVWVATNLQ